MGYSTDFSGQFDIDRPVDKKTADVLRAIKEIRRDPKNRIFDAMPDTWCQWELSEENDALMWDGGEKFYAYVEWIKFIVTFILEPQGYKVNGEVQWQGEENEDMGIIRIEDNKFSIGKAVISWEFEDSQSETIDVDGTPPVVRQLYDRIANQNLLEDSDD